jgi:hypothetical protein
VILRQREKERGPLVLAATSHLLPNFAHLYTLVGWGKGMVKHEGRGGKRGREIMLGNRGKWGDSGKREREIMQGNRGKWGKGGKRGREKAGRNHLNGPG